jgi:hypothetical protein
MRLARGRTREVYRVYTEEEYLNGAGSEDLLLTGECSTAVVSERRSIGVGERRRRRAAGLAMLAGATGLVAGVVVLNDSWSHRGFERGRGEPTGRAAASVVRPRVAVDAQARASRPTLARTVEPTHASALRLRRGSDPRTSDPGRADRVRSHALARPREVVAIAVDYVPHSPSGMSPAGNASAEVAREPAAPRKQAEFGFER